MSEEKNGMPPPYAKIPVIESQPMRLDPPQMLVNPRDVPNDYLGLALFTTICCFWPVSLFAVIKSRNVHRAVWQGDFHTASRASIWAKRLSLISLVIGLMFIGAFIACKVYTMQHGHGHGEDGGDMFNDHGHHDGHGH